MPARGERAANRCGAGADPPPPFAAAGSLPDASPPLPGCLCPFPPGAGRRRPGSSPGRALGASPQHRRAPCGDVLLLPPSPPSTRAPCLPGRRQCEVCAPARIRQSCRRCRWWAARGGRHERREAEAAPGLGADSSRPARALPPPARRAPLAHPPGQAEPPGMLSGGCCGSR